MQRITREKLIFKMDKDNDPVYRCAAGEHVLFETADCFSGMIKCEEDHIEDIDFGRVNPATGPVFVEDAKPGDVLKVTIHRIDVEETGVMTVAPQVGFLGDGIEQASTRLVTMKEDKAFFMGIDIPVRKMIGVIGTAPSGEGIETGTPGQHGGNMDCRCVCEGAILYLPVQVEGALFALGDLHMAMGDGEIGVSGVEVFGQVEVSFDVIKDTQVPTPFLESADHYMTLSSAKTLEEAGRNASYHMAKYLVDRTGISFNDAVMLLSAVGDLAVCQVVDPLVTMRMEVAKDIVKKVRAKF